MSSGIEEQSAFSFPTFSQLRKMTDYSFDPLAEAINESSSAIHRTVSNASNSSHYSERNNLHAIKDAKLHGRRRKQKKKEGDEAPVGYIHVRARRGQATDSHSLAERVRREKISERMKVLQGLVPGCEKVVGKAMMLDEIINYVQSLQNQVEFLSMKLACVNPMMFDLSDDYDCLVNQTELLPFSLLQPTLDQGTCKAYETMMNHPPVLLQNQGSFSLSQENVSFLKQIPDERQDLILNNIVLNNNMCLFQHGSKGEGPY